MNPTHELPHCCCSTVFSLCSNLCYKHVITQLSKENTLDNSLWHFEKKQHQVGLYEGADY